MVVTGMYINLRHFQLRFQLVITSSYHSISLVQAGYYLNIFFRPDASCNNKTVIPFFLDNKHNVKVFILQEGPQPRRLLC